MLVGQATSMFARCLLRVGYALCMLHICSMFVRRLLDRVNGLLELQRITCLMGPHRPHLPLDTGERAPPKPQPDPSTPNAFHVS